MPEKNIERKLAEIPSIIVEGRMPCTEEARAAVDALSREDLMGCLDHYLNNKRTLYNAFGFCGRLAEDYAIEQVGNLARRRGDFEILNRVSARYRTLAESVADEVDREDFLSAALFYGGKSK